jgi:DNA-directed RNA polymerase subunit alpha
MSLQNNILLPSKPRIVSEDGNKGVYEIDGLYPGYGHTLGNSLRRIILSSIPGCAITSVSINGVSHEFSTIEGVKEDVITLLLNLKRVRFKMVGDEAQTATLSIKGAKLVTAADISCSGQIEVLNKDQVIAETTKKDANLTITMKIERGLGYVSKEEIQKEKVEIGAIALDANFTPIRRASYEVEDMRVGDRTDHNRLRMTIETDGTLSPKTALELSVHTMIGQLQAIVGFTTAESVLQEIVAPEIVQEETVDLTKIKVDDLGLSTRTQNALLDGGIKTLAQLTKKKEEDVLALEGLGEKGMGEIKEALSSYGVSFK